MRKFPLLLITIFLLSGCAQMTTYYDNIKEKLFSSSEESKEQDVVEVVEDMATEPLEPMKKPEFKLPEKKKSQAEFRSIEEIAEDVRPSASAKIEASSTIKVGSLRCRHRHAFIDQGKVKDIRGDRVQIHITSIYLQDSPTTKFSNPRKNIIWDALSHWGECSNRNVGPN